MGLFNVFVILTLISFSVGVRISNVRKSVENSGSRNFIIYRTNTISQRPCTCTTENSCSCCEIVKIFYTSEEKRLCFNMIYQRNGLNLDLSLDSLMIKAMTVANFRPFQMCAMVPGLFFSSICVSILELNQFPRSITVCPRVEVTSKKERWQITYTCSSISTVLPAAGVPGMMMGMMPGTMTMMMMPAAGGAAMRPPGMPGAAMGAAPGGAMAQRPAGAPVMGAMMPAGGGAMAPRPPGAPPAMAPGGAMAPRPPGAPPAMAPGGAMAPRPPGAPPAMAPGGAMAPRPPGAPPGMAPGGAMAPRPPGAPPAMAPGGAMVPGAAMPPRPPGAAPVMAPAAMPGAGAMGQRPPGAPMAGAGAMGAPGAMGPRPPGAPPMPGAAAPGPRPAGGAGPLPAAPRPLSRFFSDSELKIKVELPGVTPDEGAETVEYVSQEAAMAESTLPVGQEFTVEESHGAGEIVAVHEMFEASASSSLNGQDLIAVPSENVEETIAVPEDNTGLTNLNYQNSESSDNSQQISETVVNFSNFESQSNIADDQETITEEVMTAPIEVPVEDEKILKRRKRNYDIFDVFHQSNRCERAYRICITRQRQFIVSRLGSPRKTGTNNKHKDCINNPVRIVYGPTENLCPSASPDDTNFSPSTTTTIATTVPANDPTSDTYDPLDAIVVQDDSAEGSDYYPQNIPLFPVGLGRPEIFPSRTPLAAFMIKDSSYSLNDTLSFKPNQDYYNGFNNEGV